MMVVMMVDEKDTMTVVSMVEQMDLLSVEAMVEKTVVMKVYLLVDLRADVMDDELVEWMGKLKAVKRVALLAA